jgi:hypothetical protein
MKSTAYKSPHYAVVSSLLLLTLSVLKNMFAHNSSNQDVSTWENFIHQKFLKVESEHVFPDHSSKMSVNEIAPEDFESVAP